MKLFVFTILIFLSSLSVNGQSGIRINGETQVVCEGQVQLVVSGDFVNNGTFTPSNGTIYLKGSSKQNIGGSGNNTFYGMELDNAAGADLSSDIAVTNELNLNSGLLDLVNSNAVHFDKLQTLVLDEADKLLNLGFQDEMNQIFALLPKKRQNLLFSATLNEKVEEINQILLRDPELINVAPKEKNLDQIRQLAYAISEEKKGPFLRHLIKSENMQQVLIFTASTYKAGHVADKLHKNGIDARSIHGKKSQHARTKALEEFKSGKLRALVATDLLARGIDIEFLPHVINYELPRSPKDYVHRIGRTGRAEASGEAISLISPEEEHHFKVIQKKMKISVELLDGNQVKLK